MGPEAFPVRLSPLSAAEAAVGSGSGGEVRRRLLSAGRTTAAVASYGTFAGGDGSVETAPRVAEVAAARCDNAAAAAAAATAAEAEALSAQHVEDLGVRAACHAWLLLAYCGLALLGPELLVLPDTWGTASWVAGICFSPAALVLAACGGLLYAVGLRTSVAAVAAAAVAAAAPFTPPQNDRTRRRDTRR